MKDLEEYLQPGFQRKSSHDFGTGYCPGNNHFLSDSQ